MFTVPISGSSERRSFASSNASSSTRPALVVSDYTTQLWLALPLGLETDGICPGRKRVKSGPSARDKEPEKG